MTLCPKNLWTNPVGWARSGTDRAWKYHLSQVGILCQGVFVLILFISGYYMLYSMGRDVPTWMLAVCALGSFVSAVSCPLMLLRALRSAIHELDCMQQEVCRSCGYDLRALSSDMCPECGAANDRIHLTGDAREGQ